MLRKRLVKIEHAGAINTGETHPPRVLDFVSAGKPRASFTCHHDSTKTVLMCLKTLPGGKNEGNPGDSSPFDPR